MTANDDNALAAMAGVGVQFKHPYRRIMDVDVRRETVTFYDPDSAYTLVTYIRKVEVAGLSYVFEEGGKK